MGLGGRAEKLEGADTEAPLPHPRLPSGKTRIGAPRGMQDGWGQVRAGYG